MSIDFSKSIRVGSAADLPVTRSAGPDFAPAQIPESDGPRGLAIKTLTVGKSWGKLWNMLRDEQEIYFLSVAFDLSGKAPTVLPPKKVDAKSVFKARPGDAISFTLGSGALVFPPQVLRGGLVIYITVCEADQGIEHVGEVLAQVHDDLTKDKSLVDVIQGWIKDPAGTVADEVLSAATAALQPIATILKNNGDDYEALFTGIFSANDSWEGHLTATQHDTTIELSELH